MRAVQVTDFGGPGVLTAVDVPDPLAGPAQVVVAVSAADVLTIDTVLRGGGKREIFALEPPFVPGTAVAGTVVGDGVAATWVGRRVTAITGVTGGYAQRVVVPERELVAVPDEVALETAAAMINDGRTALALLDAAEVKPGEWVLVLPGGSGLGIVLIQLARARGARVLAGARGTEKLNLASQAGAEVAIDYTDTDWNARLHEVTDASGIDVVLDGVGGQVGRAAFDATAHGGRFVGFGDSSGTFTEYSADEVSANGIRTFGPELVHIGGTPKAKGLAEQVLREAATGGVRPIVGQTFPLEQAAKAHAAVENRSARGKTLLVLD